MKKLLEEFQEIHFKKLLELYNDKVFVNQRGVIYEYIKEYEILYNMAEQLGTRESKKILNRLEDSVYMSIKKMLLCDIADIFKEKCQEYTNTPKGARFWLDKKTLDLYVTKSDREPVKIESFKKQFLEYLEGGNGIIGKN